MILALMEGEHMVVAMAHHHATTDSAMEIRGGRQVPLPILS